MEEDRSYKAHPESTCISSIITEIPTTRINTSKISFSLILLRKFLVNFIQRLKRRRHVHRLRLVKRFSTLFFDHFLLSRTVETTQIAAKEVCCPNCSHSFPTLKRSKSSLNSVDEGQSITNFVTHQCDAQVQMIQMIFKLICLCFLVKHH